MVKDHINQYNYTLNPIGIFNSIKFMYTYYPDPNNKTHIREEFVWVSRRLAILTTALQKIRFQFCTDFYFTAIVKQLVRNGVDTYMYILNPTFQALR